MVSETYVGFLPTKLPAVAALSTFSSGISYGTQPISMITESVETCILLLGTEMSVFKKVIS